MITSCRRYRIKHDESAANFFERIVPIKARSKFKRVLAFALAIVMSVSLMAFPVYADDVYELGLLQGDDVNAKLSALLTPGEDNEWEYLYETYTYKETRKGDDIQNPLWSSVNGGEYEDVIVGSGSSWFTWKIYKENITCPSLASFMDSGEVKSVRVVGTDTIYSVKIIDGRIQSELAVNESVTVKYNADKTALAQEIVTKAVIAEECVLPDGFTAGDFTVSGVNDLKASEEAQTVTVKFNGSTEYKPSAAVSVSVIVNKADVKVNIKGNVSDTSSLAVIQAGGKLPEDFITLTPADSSIDVWTIFAGKTSENVTIIYVDLPARYKNQALIAALDFILPIIREDGKTFTELVNDGMTVAELKELMNDLLEAYKWAEEHKDDTIIGSLPTIEATIAAGLLKIMPDTIVTIAEQITNLPEVLDTTTVAFGTPKHAGVYSVLVVTESENYNAAYGFGAVVVTPRYVGNNIVWNSELPSKLTVSELAAFDMSASLVCDDEVVNGANISYKYTGHYKIWGIFKIKYNSEKLPTRAGEYTQTATCYRGDNISILPAVRSFTVVAD